MAHPTGPLVGGTVQPIHAPARLDLGGASPSGSFTLRDTFAMHTIGGLLGGTVRLPVQSEMAEIATAAYGIADAMLLERSKTMGYKKKKDKND
jgi:hypothetical protein